MSKTDRILVLMMFVGGLLMCQMFLSPDPDMKTHVMTVREWIAAAGFLAVVIGGIGLVSKFGLIRTHTDRSPS